MNQWPPGPPEVRRISGGKDRRSRGRLPQQCSSSGKPAASAEEPRKSQWLGHPKSQKPQENHRNMVVEWDLEWDFMEIYGILWFTTV